MELTFLQTMILFCLQKINGERTIYSIYHLLKGKKSSQTIQDTHLFHLQPLFQTETNLSRNELEKIVAKFLSDQLLINISDQSLSCYRIWRKPFGKVFSPSTDSCFFKWLEIPEESKCFLGKTISFSSSNLTSSE